MARKAKAKVSKKILNKTLNRIRARERRESESVEARTIRLEKLRQAQRDRIQQETTQQRASRLKKLLQNQVQRLQNETPAARAERLQKLRENYYKRKGCMPRNGTVSVVGTKLTIKLHRGSKAKGKRKK